MKKQEIQTAIKKLKKCIGRKSSLVILENVLNNNGTLTVSDLEVFLTVNVGFPGKFLMNFKQLEKIVTKLPASSEFDITLNGDRVELITDKGAKFTFPSEDVEDFPEPAKCKKEIGSLNPEQIGIIKKAVKFVSSDTLRPVMNGVFLGDHIVGSDAHRLVYFQWKNTFTEETILSPSVVGMINFSDYSIFESEYTEGSRSIKMVGENETIIFREIEGVYPKYKNVIPENCPIKITMITKDVIDNVKLALITANEASELIKFEFEGGKVVISSEDLDFETNFSSELGIVEQNKNDGICFGIKGTFLLSLLADCGNTFVFQMTDPTRAILIDEDKLLMPMMLNG